MNLPEKIFNPKVSSRLGADRITFQTYTSENIKNIIKYKLGSYYDLFEDDALRLISIKVSSDKSDIRRALLIIRKTLSYKSSIYKDGDNIKITSKDVKQVLKELSRDPTKIILDGLPLYQKIFLISILKVIKFQNEIVDYMDVVSRFQYLRMKYGMDEGLNSRQIDYILDNLTSMSYIKINRKGTSPSEKRLSIGPDIDLLRLCFQEDEMLCNILYS